MANTINDIKPGFERQFSDVKVPVFDHIPEMTPYLTEPKAMYVGVPGKNGYLRLGFELDADGKSILRDLDRRAPLIVQQELYFDEEMPDMPCVYILSSGGPNVDGDRYSQNIHVKRDAMAFVSTGAATKLAVMKYNFSGMVQHIRVDEGAYLEFLPEPVYPSAHTRFICQTKAEVAETGTLVYSEIYMGGRKYYADGELFEYDILSVETEGGRPDGDPLFREKFIIEPGKRSVRDLGCMGRFDVFGNVVVMLPKDKAEEVFARTQAINDNAIPLMAGITRLPNDAGLLYKVLGMEPGPVKKAVRDFCSAVRMAVKGHPIPAEFPWR